MLLIIVPSICKEKGSPFGAPDVCHTYGLAYASLSMAVSLFFLKHHLLYSYIWSLHMLCSKPLYLQRMNYRFAVMS